MHRVAVSGHGNSYVFTRFGQLAHDVPSALPVDVKKLVEEIVTQIPLPVPHLEPKTPATASAWTHIGHLDNDPETLVFEDSTGAAWTVQRQNMTALPRITPV